MKYTLYLFISCLLVIPFSYAATIVYNLRIAEITKRQTEELQQLKPFIAALTIFNQNRTSHDHIHQNFLGGLNSLIYVKKKIYAKMDWAVAHASSKFEHIHFSRTQTDDILFTAGYGFSMNKHAKSTFSVLFGVPTHKDLGLQGIQFGTGHFGLGVQWDGAFRLEKHPNHSLYSAVRFVHFFPRNLDFEIIPIANKFKFSAGDLSDLLVAYNVRFGKQRIEVGYNATFLYNAHIKPHVQAIIDRANFIRSSFYASWARLIILKKHLSGLALALSYSFDHSPKDFGIKRGITAWALWGINF